MSSSVVQLGKIVISTLTELLKSSSQNAEVFRELNGTFLATTLVSHLDTQEIGLMLLQQMILSGGPGGEEDMIDLLDILQNTDVINTTQRKKVLVCLTGCLKESHRCRTVFRRVGGFVYIMSALLALEGSLSDNDTNSKWKGIEKRQIFLLLKEIFEVLAVSMRFEPANAKYFNDEISFSSLSCALHLLGCFSAETKINPCTFSINTEKYSNFKLICSFSLNDAGNFEILTSKHEFCCMILRYLYALTIDNFKPKPNVSSSSTEITSSLKSEEVSTVLHSKKKVTSLDLNPKQQEPKLVHPNAINTILDLLPALYHKEAPDISANLQLFASEMIKSLLRNEKNQQIMCDNIFTTKILLLCGSVIEDETHFLHSPYRYLIERIAAQKLEPIDMRTFFRPADESVMKQEVSLCHLKSKSFVPLARIKALVSMTTSKHFHLGMT